MATLLPPDDPAASLTLQYRTRDVVYYDGAVGLIPNYLMEEIFLRTTAKSLLSLKRVRKSWYNIIKDPNFVRKRFYESQSMGCTVLSSTITTTCDYLDKKFYLGSFHEGWKIENDGGGNHKWETNFWSLLVSKNSCKELWVAACNGLICIYGNYLSMVYICNPTTQEIIDLPRPSKEFEKGSCGFAFDTKRNEYKIVHLFYDSQYEAWTFEMFTLGTMSWKMMGDEAKEEEPDISWYRLHGAEPSNPIYVNACVLCFNVEDKFRPKLIKMPADINENNFLGAIQAQHNVTFLDKRSSQLLNIWMLKEERCLDEKENMWIKKYGIKLDFDLNFCRSRTPVRIQNKDILFVSSNTGELFSYDSETKKCVTIFKPESFSTEPMEEPSQIVTYMESLIPVRDIIAMN
ncbi:hypothetical protein MKX01_036767 [Papaver californicum]|nr:hypothetical protein MKX01_036767 [Papaver californicum]